MDPVLIYYLPPDYIEQISKDTVMMLCVLNIFNTHMCFTCVNHMNNPPKLLKESLNILSKTSPLDHENN